MYLCTSPSLDHVESNVSWNDIDYDTVAQELGDYTSEVGFKEEVLRVWTDIGMLDVKTLAELEFRVEVVDVTVTMKRRKRWSTKKSKLSARGRSRQAVTQQATLEAIQHPAAIPKLPATKRTTRTTTRRFRKSFLPNKLLSRTATWKIMTRPHHR